MKSPVFFANLRSTIYRNLTSKINRLLDKTDVSSLIRVNDLVAIKMHFGEKGVKKEILPLYHRYS
jgi:uncharacterized Fe-S center protein